MPKPIYSLAAAAALAPFAAHAQHPERAIWFWQSPKSPFGSIHVVGDSTSEDAAIARLKAWGVTTVYGSYQGDALANPGSLRAWNAKLSKAGIKSYLLLSETDYLFDTARPALDAHLKGYLAFNTAAAPAERFAGLSFDVEPHILAPSSHSPGWKAAEPLARRAYLDDLLHLYQHVRTLIPASTPLEATLPAWYSHLNGSIGWANALDRDQYFTALASTCDRLSIMAFELDSSAKVLASSEEEVGVLHGKARIALRANLGHEWQTVAQFWQAAHEVEQATHHGIEIQDFAILAADEDAAAAHKP
jgi:hypothetical protein